MKNFYIEKRGLEWRKKQGYDEFLLPNWLGVKQANAWYTKKRPVNEAKNRGVPVALDGNKMTHFW